MTARVRWVRFVVVLSLGMTLAAQPTTALANHTANCSEYGIYHRLTGYLSDSWQNHRYGVRANIEGLPLNLCTLPRPGEGSTSVGWVAIEANPAGCCNIVQIGMGRCYPNAYDPNCDPTTLRDFTAWGRDPNTPGCSGAPKKIPTASWFQGWSPNGVYTVKELADGRINAFSSAGSLFTPVMCWTNAYVAVATESFDYGDALGHNTTNRLTFSNEQFQTSLNGAWLTLPSLCNQERAFDRYGVPFTLEAIFKCEPTGPTINVYTDR